LPQLLRYSFDREYVQRLIEEDPETERHFTKYFGDLLTLKLGHRLRSKALIEDAKQETFVRVLTTLKQKGGLESPEGLGAFVNSVCNNILFEMYRSGSRADQLDDEHDQPNHGGGSIEATLIADEDRRRVREALESLPTKDRTLLQWLFFEERDKDAVCRELNIDRAYLRVLLHRAKLRFRQHFMQAVQ
jgi:RNA polymerase sigma-70 factor (ECF subfamily)